MLYPAAVLILLLQALSLLSPHLTRLLVDDAIPRGSEKLLYAVVAGMVLVALLSTWLGWLQERIFQLLIVRLDAALARGLLAHILRLPYRYLEGQSLAKLMQGFQGLRHARTALTVDAVATVTGSVSAVVFILMMYRILPQVTSVVALIGVVSFVLAIVAGRHQEALERQLVEATVRERESAIEIFTRMTTHKAAGAADRAVDRWLSLLRSARLFGARSAQLNQSTHVAIDFLGQAQLQLLWLWGGLRVIQGSLHLGELLAYTLLAGLFHAAVGRLAKSFVKLRTVKPQLKDAQELLSQKLTVPVVHTRARPHSRPGIEIRNLWYRYGDERKWIFDGLNLRVAPGEIHHLRGPSGFGKTTLLKLVAGLYDPTAGAIRIGGRPPQEAREALIFLPQHIYTFNASVRENLQLFSAGAPFSRLMQVAELTGLAEWVEQLPMGYNTLLAPGGGNFSGGQRQLIALTAALASDRPVLLLDEATANLDATLVRRLALSPLLSGRTILYAGHDSRLTA